jgi:hypothetical protein
VITGESLDEFAAVEAEKTDIKSVGRARPGPGFFVVDSRGGGRMVVMNPPGGGPSGPGGPLRSELTREERLHNVEILFRFMRERGVLPKALPKKSVVSSLSQPAASPSETMKQPPMLSQSAAGFSFDDDDDEVA